MASTRTLHAVVSAAAWVTVHSSGVGTHLSYTRDLEMLITPPGLPIFRHCGQRSPRLPRDRLHPAVTEFVHGRAGMRNSGRSVTAERAHAASDVTRRGHLRASGSPFDPSSVFQICTLLHIFKQSLQPEQKCCPPLKSTPRRSAIKLM